MRNKKQKRMAKELSIASSALSEGIQKHLRILESWVLAVEANAFSKLKKLLNKERVRMSNEEKLEEALRLVEEVYYDVVPDQSGVTVAENDFFREIDILADSINSDIQQLTNYVEKVELNR